MAEEDDCEENEVTRNCIKQGSRGSSMEEGVILHVTGESVTDEYLGSEITLVFDGIIKRAS